MSKRQEIKDLVQQLKDLQLQESGILDRIDQLTAEGTRSNQGGPPTRGSDREFAVGDRVRITNPRPFQQAVGIITKITASRITVTTGNGTKIQRARNNVVAAPGRYVDDE
jgi:hypothetical protein